MTLMWVKLLADYVIGLFLSSDYKVQFQIWLDKAYPPKGQAEDRARTEGEEASEIEEENEEETEEETHEDRDYNEDRLKL